MGILRVWELSEFSEFDETFFHNLDSFLQKKKKKAFSLSITSLPPRCLIPSSLRLVERVLRAASNLKWKSVPSITDESSADTELASDSYSIIFSFDRFSLCFFYCLPFPTLSEFVFPSVPSFLFLMLLLSDFVILIQFSATTSPCGEKTTHCPKPIFTSQNFSSFRNRQ